jgi:hypothetical protein
MIRHFKTLKSPCPTLLSLIVLTNPIKDFVLANRIYKETLGAKPLMQSPSIVHIDTTMKPNVPAVVLRVVAMCEYVYLIYVREFMMRNEPVYKLGKSTQKNVLRASSYPKGSVLLLQVSCRDCTLAEQKLMTIFKANYQQSTEYGLEYFRGNVEDMMDDMYNAVRRLDRQVEGPVIDAVVEASDES